MYPFSKRKCISFLNRFEEIPFLYSLWMVCVNVGGMMTVLRIWCVKAHNGTVKNGLNTERYIWKQNSVHIPNESCINTAGLKMRRQICIAKLTQLYDRFTANEMHCKHMLVDNNFNDLVTIKKILNNKRQFVYQHFSFINFFNRKIDKFKLLRLVILIYLIFKL